MNNCTLAALCAALISGFLVMAAMPTGDPDVNLVRTNESLKKQVEQLQTSLIDATQASDKIYAEAIKGLNEAKAQLEAEKKRISAECKK